MTLHRVHSQLSHPTTLIGHWIFARAGQTGELNQEILQQKLRHIQGLENQARPNPVLPMQLIDLLLRRQQVQASNTRRHKDLGDLGLCQFQLLKKNKWHSIAEIESELHRMERQYSGGRGDKLPVFNRTTQSDIQVKNWIKQMRKSCNQQSMKPSKSLFLREYRNSGFACEQKRFGALFEEVFER